MSAQREKTRTPGIFKRGSRYSFVYRTDDGKQHWGSARTLDEARLEKSRLTADVSRGEHDEKSNITLHAYAREWVKSYRGRSKKGFRENTRTEYERLLEAYALKYFPAKTKLTEISPRRVAAYIDWLCDEKTQGKALSDSSVRNALVPLRALCASARRDGIVRVNPTAEADLPDRPTVEDDDDDAAVKAMSRKELTTLLALIPAEWKTFFNLLAGTGLRVSEALALQWRHLQLDGSTPHVKVRRAVVRDQVGPPKSRRGKRDIPLDHELVVALRQHRKDSEWHEDDNLVFPARNGAVMSQGNLRRRVLKPAAEEACVPWVGFHSFRHTCATILFAEGRNAVQVQRWLGHHSPAFTLNVYVGLLDGDLGAPLSLATMPAIEVARDDLVIGPGTATL
jgi:integrase